VTLPQKYDAPLDAVDAYDRVAPTLAGMYAGRKAYFEAIDELVLTNLRFGARSMLDVGCGSGLRAAGIAQKADISDLVLLEPSSGMRELIAPGHQVWASRIEGLVDTPRKFDVITCLWNVLGHVNTPDKRAAALRNMRAMLTANGLIFLDVQNRYNAQEYGWLKTAGRRLYDSIRPAATNGDVTIRWESGVETIVTTGHVFTRREMLELIRAAALSVQKLVFVNYRTGQQRSSQFAGSMFFVLQA